MYFTKTLTGILVYQKLKSKNLNKLLNLQKISNIEEKIIPYEMDINEEKIIKEKNKILIDQKKITFGNLGFYDFKKLDWLKSKFSDHLENILSLKNKAEEYNSKFLLLYIPEKIEIYSFLRNNQVGYSNFTKENIPRLKRRIFDFCHNSKIICLDPTQNLKTNAVVEFKDYYLSEQLYWHYDGHLRSHGNKIIADSLFNFINKNLNLD